MLCEQCSRLEGEYKKFRDEHSQLEEDLHHLKEKYEKLVDDYPKDKEELLQYKCKGVRHKKHIENSTW